MYGRNTAETQQLTAWQLSRKDAHAAHSPIIFFVSPWARQLTRLTSSMRREVQDCSGSILIIGISLLATWPRPERQPITKNVIKRQATRTSWEIGGTEPMEEGHRSQLVVNKGSSLFLSEHLRICLSICSADRGLRAAHLTQGIAIFGELLG